MARTETKTCKTCGAKFESPLRGGSSSSTVNCPKHRGKQPLKVTRSSGPKKLSASGKTCTVQTATGGKCGKPAVYAFQGSGGETFAECSEHHR